ncbi:MAG: hypothetical protein AAGD06_03945 [Acidobacteriota bacterium]
MPKTVDFLVTNNVTQNTGQRVLVFLTPTGAADGDGLHYAPWQILNPSANGGCHPFTFQDSIQLAVEDQATCSRSAMINVKGNQLYRVTNDNNQGPTLDLTAEPPYSATLTSVKNQTDPAITLRSVWYVHGSPAVSQSDINLGHSVSFELAPTLFFMVAIPTMNGFNYRLQQFSGETRYIIPPGVSSVSVNWSRSGGISGADELTFDPPSASPLRAPEAEQGEGRVIAPAVARRTTLASPEGPVPSADRVDPSRDPRS